MGSWQRAAGAAAMAVALTALTSTPPAAMSQTPTQTATVTGIPPTAAESGGTETARAKPKGKKSDWSYGFANKARWNPCQPIRWGYNPRGGYRKALKHTKKAVRRIKRHTGLPLVYAGKTSFSRGPFTDNPDGLDIVVRWATSRKVSQLGGASGYGGGMAGALSADADWEAYNGFVILNRAQKPHLRKGFAKRGHPTWGQVITHELLHALGLGHTDRRSQLMYPYTHAGNHRFGKGDRRGMKKIGASQGCLDAGVR